MDDTRGETQDTGVRGRGGGGADACSVVLVVAWCRDEPWRVGEVLGSPSAPPGRSAGARVAVFGRGEEGPGRIGSYRQAPGANVPARPWASPRLSREQLSVSSRADSVEVVNLGRRELLHRGSVVGTARLAPGELVEVRNQLLLLATLRPALLPSMPGLAPHPFGEPDANGIVGESPATWELRRRLQFVGRRAGHALVLGPSGAGKELAAAAIHGARGRGPLVSRNAATLPEGLVDAELFGNVRNYPNPGMAERPGLIGAAHGGTLFLDELGELPAAAQAHLLRVLDAGEYQRLGDATVLRSRFRLVAATNRPLSALKEDVAARFSLVVNVPGLDRRREDVPLLARHILGKVAREDSELAGRFFTGGEPRVTSALVSALVTLPYTTHVRQLATVLWRSLTDSPGDVLEVPAGLPAETSGAGPGEVAQGGSPSALDTLAAWAGRPAGAIPPEVLQAALDAHNGQVEAAARALGLPSRFAMSRQIRRHRLVRRSQGGG